MEDRDVPTPVLRRRVRTRFAADSPCWSKSDFFLPFHEVSGAIGMLRHYRTLGHRIVTGSAKINIVFALSLIPKSLFFDVPYDDSW